MRELRYAVIDAFASAPFTGNAAAVVFEADGLGDSEMRAIAGEFNLSETTFILRPDAPDGDVRFRWFTPAVEVTMCGHATLAGVHALVESGRLDSSHGPTAALRIETLGGMLLAGVEPVSPYSGAPGRLIWLDLVPPRLTPREFNTDKVAALLRADTGIWEPARPAVVSQDGDLIILVRDFQTLNGLRPDFEGIADWCTRQGLRGILVSTTKTLSASIDAQSRFFAPAAGVDEDPVTGSAHAPLAAYLVAHGLVNTEDDGSATLRCAQAKAGGRAGLLFASVTPRAGEGYNVRIAGKCFTTMRGTLLVG
ncbi:MAG TPA: PhzF family phenazine biosynthesis protein [Phycisphaerae bacterium]|jgi:PhzF family phenazine biosynthesis protein